MHAWKHVFVHVDTRPHAPYALDKALLVAEAFGGSVTAFDSVSGVEGLPFAFPNVRVDRMLELAAAARSQELREELNRREPRVQVDATVVKGSSADVLLRSAENNQADIILKAVSAADVERRTAAGTAILRVLREAPVPVWLCSPHRRRASRVLSVVNLASAKRASEHVVHAGARVASLQGAELHVLCVDRQLSRQVFESKSSTRQRLDLGEGEIKPFLEALQAPAQLAPPLSAAQAVALHTIEKAVFDLEPDMVVLSRDGSALSGISGTHLVERLFCRTECSMLLLPPGYGLQPTRAPFERRPAAGTFEQLGHAANMP